MPMVISNHQRIFYRFEGERGAFLMLHHGLFGSHQDWYRAGYVEELAKEFRLVIPDARGHGRSDRPTDPADYRPERFVEDLIEIMNGLGIRNLHFLGYGLGALIGLEMLRRFPERVRITVLGGESGLMLPPTQEYWRGLAQQLEQGTLAELLGSLRTQQRLVRSDPADPPEEDRAGVLALLQSVSQWDAHGEERVTVTSPVTLFSGSDDAAAERVERARTFVNRARLVMFPGFNHVRLFEERVQITQELVRLLKSGRRDDSEGYHRRHSADHTEAQGGQEQMPRGPDRRVGGADPRASDQQYERRIRDRRSGGSRNDSGRPGYDGLRSEAQGANVKPAEGGASAQAEPAPEENKAASSETPRSDREESTS